MTVKVVWSPRALRQVARAYDYLVEFNPDAARQVVEHLIQAGDSLAHFPHRGRLVPHTVVREPVTVYPYIIRYQVMRDVVRILRVRHSAQRPTTR